MSASRNADANAGQPGEFGSHIARDGPLETTGHQPGKLVGNDAKPEFHAKTLPPGSAPKESTFQPNTSSEIPGQALNPDNDELEGKESTQTTASSTLGGATSADVHQGYGHPGQGQTSRELRDNSSAGGLAARGAEGVGSGLQGVDERVSQPSQRGLEKEGAAVAGRKEGTGQEKGTAAEDRLPESL
ncbi:uncharacterized protein KY384_006676 [Bacidia gigantensis]|uniref:uncharacterized protein n=1 Tax=Bacidia gigantensis TaxID=2732470 RepID=UPI001D047985|nr:uncharacterized protein KY384_006676 [Bacidia gigantensis]KAG8528987.1 hypothetical protein KY384_006676 [Bacidia gigantensis]